MPLDGLGDAPKLAAAIAIKEVGDTLKVQLAHTPDDTSQPATARLAIQGLLLRMSRTKEVGNSDYNLSETRIAEVNPRGSGDNIAYSFGLYTPKPLVGGSSTAFTTGLRQIVSNPFEHKIFSLESNEDFTSVKRVESIATQFGTDWDYSILKASVPSVKDGAKDSTLYAELWTDYASAGKSDYMVGGWWLLAPNNPAGDYRFGALAKGENYNPRDSFLGAVKREVTGEATYKGNAAGLHVSSENGMVSIQRLLGKVTLTADFEDSANWGSIEGEINNLSLNGKNVPGQLLLPKSTFNWDIRPILADDENLNPKSNIGNIDGINYMGDWAGNFLGNPSGLDQPTGIVGVVGGSGGGNSFVASFGAKKVENE